jgi:hypothetical protein
MSTSEHIQSIQAEDEGDVSQVIDTLLHDRRERRRREEQLSTESRVRELLRLAHEAMSVGDDRVSEMLALVHDLIQQSEGYADLYGPDGGRLVSEAGLDADEAADVWQAYRTHRRTRRRDRVPSPADELTTLSQVAKALGHVTAVHDLTPRAPVTMESLDDRAVVSANDPIPIGRKRLPADTEQDPKDAAVEIPHASCDHIIVVAEPRRGKDSTITSIGMNLQRQHGYKYISVFDDGRMETPMLSIPNDDPNIRRNLDKFDQDPRSFDANVYVPATEGLPDRLPENFQPFTIGIDSLTPRLLLRIAGVRSSDKTAEDRIRTALDRTLNAQGPKGRGSGTVPELALHLRDLAEEGEATITWTEKEDDHSGGEVTTYETSYSVSQSKALEQAASRVTHLAQQGIITGADAATNLDMYDIVASQEQAAVLCCNFLPEGMRRVKYVLIDLWLRLIRRVKDESSRLPRVAVEMRELKNIAPSRIGNVPYEDAIKSLRQTIYLLTTQGGSRRIMLLGSTQKLNDVYKAVRTNMATKILLKLGQEEILTLDKAFDFSPAQKEQLESFDTGMGMLIAQGDEHWPIQWRGAPCGLGLGDVHWLDRFGWARGARVRKFDTEPWPPRDVRGDADRDPEWWVHVPDLEVRSMDDPPAVGERYSEWYLLDTDFPDHLDPADITQHDVERALAARREYESRSDLALQQYDSGEYIHVRYGQSTDDRRVTAREIIHDYNVTPALMDWLVTDEKRLRQQRVRDKCIEALLVLKQEDTTVTSQNTWSDYLSFSRGSLSNYITDEELLDPCFTVGPDGEYHLTDLGREALNVPWEAMEEDYREGQPS